jgi:hypothetical protein
MRVLRRPDLRSRDPRPEGRPGSSATRVLGVRRALHHLRARRGGGAVRSSVLLIGQWEQRRAWCVHTCLLSPPRPSADQQHRRSIWPSCQEGMTDDL